MIDKVYNNRLIMKFDFNKLLERTEKLGNRMANNAHKVVICGLLLFIGYQLVNFGKPIEYKKKYIEKSEEK